MTGENKKPKDIHHFGDFLKTYKNKLFAPEQHVRETFIEVVEDVMGFRLEERMVSYTPHTKTLTLQTGGPIKSEILLQKKDILTHLKGRLGERSAPENIL